MTSLITLTHRVTGAVLWSGSALSMRLAVEDAARACVDLSGVDLSGADLSGVDLSGERLRGASLRHANLDYSALEGADLRDIDARFASFRHANLKCTHLEHADLVSADLRGVDLEDADLWGVNFRGARGITFALAGSLLGYRWSLLGRPDEDPELHYGCETFALSAWTPERIDALCTQHSRGDTRYRDALRALVAYCGEVAALESPSLEAAE